MEKREPGRSPTEDPSAAELSAPAPGEQWIADLSALLSELESATADAVSAPPLIDTATDNQLVQVRLGIAAGLFAALRCKHAAVASHSLRVALTCSAWAARKGLDDRQRDCLELAGLLHDVGMIGVPDHILLKPKSLDLPETILIRNGRRLSCEILRACSAESQVLEIVEHVATWYDGTHPPQSISGKQIPLGARMLGIVEAFDSMVTDHVFRPAMSQERALSELFRCAGTQFDPDLIEEFAELGRLDQAQLHREASRRWLHTLDPHAADFFWRLNCESAPAEPDDTASLFQSKLLDNMHDAVVFIDAGYRILTWNRGAERLTGIAGASILQRRWLPELLQMRDEKGDFLSTADCPVACAVSSGVQSLRRLTILGRGGEKVPVDVHAIPVATRDGTKLGATLLLHDASSEISLEQRCQNLHEKATRDPLTQLANRAEFDRVHALFVAAHQQRRLPCSLIICDIDRFKRVNDTYGHQAGDEVIQCLARLLRNACRAGDLVARYGGEEFVLLCADCGNATATRRAEQIREAFCHVQQVNMDGDSVSASFGVTEIQPGDTPETMLRRADRALLMAKDQGRNRVVQLGTGSRGEEEPSRWSFRARKGAASDVLFEQTLVTPVPVTLAIEKLRGFVADHEAKITRIEANHVELEVNDQPPRSRRGADRPATFLVLLQFEEERQPPEESRRDAGGASRTRMHLRIKAKERRDRRRGALAERARTVLLSFRTYLVASSEDQNARGGVFRKAKQVLLPWLLSE